MNVVVKSRKIHSAAGNMRYLADTKEHPETCLVYSTCAPELWKDYTVFCHQQFEKSNQKGYQCVEAREDVFVLPNSFYSMPMEYRKHFLEAVVKILQKQYGGVEIYAALHAADKDENNMHIHVMYMERKRLKEKTKVAYRKMYFDPAGRQVRAGKDARDKNGVLLPGYTMVPKGEVYSKVSWSAKNKTLRSKDFLHEVKILWRNLLNRHLVKGLPGSEGMDIALVYDRAKAYTLPLQAEIRPLKYRNPEKQQQAILKAAERNKDIVACNDIRKKYNQLVTRAVLFGADREELMVRRQAISAEIKAAIDEKDTGRIKDILWSAVEEFERSEAERLPDLQFAGETKASLDSMVKGAEAVQQEMIDERNRKVPKDKSLVQKYVSEPQK